MISSIAIEGYRGFEHFHMPDLGRINLLVGSNNCGKTSVLEALHLLTSQGDPESLVQILWGRGERMPMDPPPRRPEWEMDISHLFTGHQVHIGSRFKFSAENDNPGRYIEFALERNADKEPKSTSGAPQLHVGSFLKLSGNPMPLVRALPLSRRLGLSYSVYESIPDRTTRERTEIDSPRFVRTSSLDSDDLAPLWDRVTLTPEEDLVVSALQVLEPNLQAIASQRTNPYYGSGQRGGFIVRLSNYEQPVPIGTLGEGIWRMLALAITITQCRNSVLLVDEIDTGLHFSVMTRMWHMICRAAEQFNVQVFATSHSSDCIASLAEMCREQATSADGICVHRIDKGRSASIRYSEEEMRTATTFDIEMR
jgi:hypothetical protein